VSDRSVLRQGDAADVPAVMQVMTRAFDPAFGEAWNEGQCLGILTLPDTWLVVAERDGVIRGFALSRLLIDDAELLLLAVDPLCQRRGIATALIGHAADLAEARGARRLFLEVRDGNPAMDLYRAASFGQIGRRRDYYRGSGGLRDAITLARPLG
jgi:[ribosomal protein S18]-alanine N-acetyltransferase